MTLSAREIPAGRLIIGIISIYMVADELGGGKKTPSVTRYGNVGLKTAPGAKVPRSAPFKKRLSGSMSSEE
jgi:hypothetical protein